MKKILLLLLIGLSISSSSVAQDYKTGIGFRGGFFNGLSIKHFVSSKAAVEGIVSSRWNGLQVTGLYEIHNVAFNTNRLNWYYGAGAHVGFWDENHKTNWGNKGESYTVVGIDGILGLEYNFREIPINISLDWKPAWNLSGYQGFWADGAALSIRYIF
jgi:hypothetical protein